MKGMFVILGKLMKSAKLQKHPSLIQNDIILGVVGDNLSPVTEEILYPLIN